MKIGILGGSSSISTQEFYRVVLLKLASLGFNCFDDTPMFVILDMPFRENISSLPENKKILDAAILYFNNINPDFIVIPCNTLHSYHDCIAKNICCPVINMIDLVKKIIVKKNYSSPLLLSTTPVQENNLYESDEYRLVYPTPEDSVKINQIIQELCNGLKPNSHKDLLNNIINKYTGCDCYIYGCTELHYIWQRYENHISSLEVLAEYTVNNIIHENIKEDKK